ncbi:MAG: hypothetical protein WBP93_22480 [Pyrinomonadaceae bacterium]
MSDEELEKRMEFIIEQQAQSTAKIGQIEDIVGRLAKASLDRFEATDKRIDDVDERIAALVDAHIRTEESVREIGESVKKTDENLRNLIAVVDRYFSEGLNGKQEG